MSLFLRMILILASLLTMFFMMKRIRQSKVQIEDSIFWIIFSFILIVVSIFPVIADWLTKLLGIYSTVNFVFLLVIFILLIKVFLMTIRISQLDTKLRELTQKIAIDESQREENQQKKQQ